MFTFNIETEDGRPRVVATTQAGDSYDIPEWAKFIAVDSDGQVFAYESKNIKLMDAFWQDVGADEQSRMNHIGNMEFSQPEVWKETLTEIKVVVNQVVIKTQSLSPGRLRGRIIEIIDNLISKGDTGNSRAARNMVGNVEPTVFSNYTTMKLICSLASSGIDLRLTGSFLAAQIIDDAAQQALRGNDSMINPE